MPYFTSCTLSLYCDHREARQTGRLIPNGVEAGVNEHVPGEFPHVIHGPSISACQTEARLAGWRFHRNGANTCPRCRPKGLVTRRF